MAEELTNKPTRRAERIGKYEILGHVATGGMGVVYKARDNDLDRLVALKILPPDLAKNHTTLERFKREARAAAQLRHENIVAIFDIGEANGTYYIAFEFIEGTDLQDYISRQCKLDAKDARQIMIQATRALAHAHELHVVHRDIKPSNFLLTYKEGRLVVKLTDFGLAIRTEDDAEFRLTKDKSTVGTVDYMSPEQATDSRSVDIRSDIYSLGCTFFHMLAGQAPFAKGALPERIIRHMQDAPPDLRSLNKHVPKSFAAIINRMLEKKPADRYQTPAELLKDLEHPDRVVRAKGQVGNPEPPQRKTGGALTDEIDKVQISAETAHRTPPRAETTAHKPPPKVETAAKVQVSSESVELVPLKLAEQPKPPRRTDPALRIQVEPAAATKMRLETAEVETPRLEKPKKRSHAGNSPLWMYAVGGSVAMLVVILFFAILKGDRTPSKPKAPVAAPKIIPRPIEAPPPELPDTSPNKMGVPAPELTLLDPSFAKVDRADLRKEYMGLFGTFPGIPDGSKTLRVSRLAPTGPGSCRTLSEALAQTQPDQWTLIEIADNGPIYLSALPPLSRCRVVLRGAVGFHPLLAWETPKKPADPKAPRTLLTLSQGSLVLDNLDVVMKANDDAPATLFDLADSDFFCRNCNFALLGKAQQPITLLRRHIPPDDLGSKRASQTWLKRCYVHGPEVSLLSLREASTHLLLEESLIVGQEQPLIQVRGNDVDALGLYCVRSTLVTSQVLLRWQAPEGKRASPRIVGRVLDSILSRDDAKAPLGDMMHLVENLNLYNVSWRATNSLYAGWKRLLVSSQKHIAGNELDMWQQQWDYKGPDRSLADPWPPGPPSALETQPASTFLPIGPVVFEAAAGHGALGAVIGWLPGDPEAWVERAYEPKPAATIPPPGLTPVIDDFDDGLYHGERIDLNKTDLGKHLQDKLLRMKPAPRVVMYLTGTGTCQTSSLRVKGVEHLVLYFLKTPDQKNALTLELNPAAIAQRSPIIEMTDGHLELIGARVHLSPITLVPHILSLQNADLTLKECRLEGPLVKSTDTFKSLIAMGNTDETPTTLLVRDSLLLSSKTLIQLRDNVQLKAKNAVFLSFADAVQIAADGPIRSMTHILDHNTFAVRHAVFNLRQGKDFEPVGVVGLYASSNAFLRPFGEDFDKGALLRGAESWTALGHWLWQGRNNVYDARQFAFFASAGKLAAERQTLKDWQQAWGPAAEQTPLSFDGAPANKLITLDTALQFDRLVLPPQLRGDPGQPPPGANLVGLGLVKKKG